LTSIQVASDMLIPAYQHVLWHGTIYVLWSILHYLATKC